MAFQEIDILLVEDREMDAELMILKLRGHGAANRVEWVQNGMEAIDFLLCKGKYAQRRHHNPKLVLLDLLMPVMTGVQVLEFMRGEPSIADIPVIITTAMQQDDASLICAEHPAATYLVKPFELTDLLDAIRKLGLMWVIVK